MKIILQTTEQDNVIYRIIKNFNSIIKIGIGIFILIIIILLISNFILNVYDYFKTLSKMSKEDRKNYKIAFVENNEIKNTLSNFETFIKNEKIKEWKTKIGLDVSNFIFTGKSILPIASLNSEESLNFTISYIIKKEDDIVKFNLIKRGLIGNKIFKKNFENEVYEELTIFDESNYKINYDIIQSDIFVGKNYLFKTITFKPQEENIGKILINNENIDDYLMKFNYNNIRDELNERILENKRIMEDFELKYKIKWNNKK